MQSLVYTPIPPAYYAVNGKMTSIMPLGTHVVLSLEPGRHTFVGFLVGGGGIFPISWVRYELEADLEADQTYYIGMRHDLLKTTIESVNTGAGREIIEHSALAKLIHQPATIHKFTAALAAAESRRKAGGTVTPVAQAGSQSSNPVIQGALPSAQQVSDFLEIIGAVALVAVMIFGAAAGASSAQIAPPAVVIPSSPSAVVGSPLQQRVPRDVALSLNPTGETLRSSSGTLAEILNSKESTTLYFPSSGLRYQIEDGRIVGNDGGRFRVLGSNVFSDTGITYQVIGNNVFTSDGHSCTKTGVIISCR
jgi:hypothetical protein